MANLNVTYEEMRTASNQLMTGKTEIEGQLQRLKSMVDGLVNGGYVTDQSSRAFQTSYDEFNRGVTDTVGGLEGMSQYLVQAADALENTDAELARALNR